MERPLILAHRGASLEAPENTLAAFRLALEQGADGWELDVHRSRDGHLVVCHDERVDRTTDGSGLIREMTLADLGRLDAGAWFDRRFAGERIPTLDQVWALAEEAGGIRLLNVELKLGFAAYPGIEEQLAEWIESHGLVDRVIVSSFNHFSLLRLGQVAPQVRTGILYMAAWVEPWAGARRVGARSLHPYHPTLVPPLVEAAHAQGLEVYPFTVDEPARLRELAAMGVDGLITGRPAEARAVVAAP
ncbi:glycerophosphodiester phosphodiesterase [Limnochorda pilosa]|uniref:GP-PDE domain-containing protein n=1 Tax=Limnochorda pilosa TaxID=1555112 RepID=A0A0K2SFZ6_LIMPI|nr:glycerophosphodiester phosphodiesterase [Limnochorda pilosa]BAS26028.1 hypothetical protein LIP_0171 [Limnochorda pilosa]